MRSHAPKQSPSSTTRASTSVSLRSEKGSDSVASYTAWDSSAKAARGRFGVDPAMKSASDCFRPRLVRAIKESANASWEKHVSSTIVLCRVNCAVLEKEAVNRATRATLRICSGSSLRWAGYHAAKVRTMPRELLMMRPHSDRASSQRAYETLVRKTKRRAKAGEESAWGMAGSERCERWTFSGTMWMPVGSSCAAPMPFQTATRTATPATNETS
mmetsp:Transcript_8766/g.28866  ORF Transcript_8766/g.28866 Transcript_8766/m.28866 type:complete len:215 (+) Transcript_8766:507-1151(+)